MATCSLTELAAEQGGVAGGRLRRPQAGQGPRRAALLTCRRPGTSGAPTTRMTSQRKRWTTRS